jgi:hypothetical protein
LIDDFLYKSVEKIEEKKIHEGGWFLVTHPNSSSGGFMTRDCGVSIHNHEV